MWYFTLRQAARKLGLPATTLSTYLTTGKIPKPKSMTSGAMTIHLWTADDLENARKLLPKIKNGRKTRYQKQKNKPRANKPVPNKKKK